MMKRLLPKSLFGRGLLIVAVPVILIQLVTAYFFFSRHWENVTRHMTRTLTGDVAFVTYLMGNQNEQEKKRIAYLFARQTSIGADWQPGKKLDMQTSSDDYPDLQQSLRDALVVPFTLRLEKEEIIIRIGLADGVLNLDAPSKRLESPTTTIFILGMTGASFVFLCIALLFLRNQVRPIRHLAEVAERFGKGRDTEDFKPSGAQEVRRAGRAFLIMRERLRRQIRTRTDMLSGISHDLRTPLTRMKLQLAMLPESAEIEELRADVAQMEGMIGEYLDFARGGAGEESVHVSLKELLEDIARDYRRMEADVSLTAESAPELELRAGAFRRMIGNILDNGLRFGTRCAISLRTVANKAEVIIDDDGPGIPPEKREEVFRPFTRLDLSRNLNVGGVGLGLTIARDVALKAGGDITLSDSPLGGLRVVVRLPL